MKEIWKNIKEFENLYQVSNLGQIKSLRRGNILKQSQTKDNYLIVHLSNGKYQPNKLVHRLVAEAFLENIENKPQVNHKNGMKTNNRIDNLEWVTQEENQQHAYKTGLNKPRYGRENHKSKKVIQYDLQMNRVAEYDGIREAERNTGYNSTAISNCCLGKTKTSYGYVWKHKNEEACR